MGTTNTLLTLRTDSPPPPPRNRSMSWQTYVDTNLVGTGAVTQAAIIGHDGNTWATSAGFAVSPANGAALANAFKDATAIRSNGFELAGTRYVTIRADDRSVYGKKGSAGVITVKTSKAILIGVYNEKIQPGTAANVVEKLADYLIGQGF